MASVNTDIIFLLRSIPFFRMSNNLLWYLWSNNFMLYISYTVYNDSRAWQTLGRLKLSPWVTQNNRVFVQNFNWNSSKSNHSLAQNCFFDRKKCDKSTGKLPWTRIMHWHLKKMRRLRSQLHANLRVYVMVAIRATVSAKFSHNFDRFETIKGAPSPTEPPAILFV